MHLRAVVLLAKLRRINVKINSISLRKILEFDSGIPEEKNKIVRIMLQQRLTSLRKKEKKSRGEKVGGGGDFYDDLIKSIKLFFLNERSIEESLSIILNSRKSGKENYIPLMKNFLRWWEEKRRWRNPPFSFQNDNLHKSFSMDDKTIKIEDIIHFMSNYEGISTQDHVIIYPYYYIKMPLSLRGARIGLWCLKEKFPEFSYDSFRILDIPRSRSFSLTDIALTGNEAVEFRNALTEIQDIFDKKYEARISKL